MSAPTRDARIPFSPEERAALLRLCFLVRMGVLLPLSPALAARVHARLAA